MRNGYFLSRKIIAIRSNAASDSGLMCAEPLSKNPISRRLMTRPFGSWRKAIFCSEISAESASVSSWRSCVTASSSETLASEGADAEKTREAMLSLLAIVAFVNEG